jgi:hypothetical protein
LIRFFTWIDQIRYCSLFCSNRVPVRQSHSMPLQGVVYNIVLCDVGQTPTPRFLGNRFIGLDSKLWESASSKEYIDNTILSRKLTSVTPRHAR